MWLLNWFGALLRGPHAGQDAALREEEFNEDEDEDEDDEDDEEAPTW